MLACMAEQTGMEVAEGCDLAARLYAVAAQVYGLYVQADWVARQCFPQTAQGEYLDRHATLRGLSRKQGSRAQGIIRFSVSTPSDTDRVIPAGTVCMTAALVRFETTQDATLWAGGLYTDVSARAVEIGSGGNATAGSIQSMAVAPVGVASCTNPQSFTGGVDAEEDESLRERILASYRRLPNGANAAFYQQGALSFDQVAAAAVLPRNRGQGTVDVVVATASGTPEQSLLTQLQEYFRQRREIAVDVAVLAPELVEVDVTVQVKPGAGHSWQTVKERVEQAIQGWFTGERLGKSVLKAQLGNVIYACEGVENYAITLPNADVAVTERQLPRLGTLTVEEMA